MSKRNFFPTIFSRVQAVFGVLLLSMAPALAQNSSITLLSPNGGQWWFAGETGSITWQTTGAIPNVKLEFSRNNGANWQIIVASTPNDGVFEWSVSDPVTNAALIRVSDATNSTSADVSDHTFFITYRGLVEFTLAQGNPVLSGASGDWDEQIRERGWFMYDDGTYHVWYGGWSGAYNQSIPDLVNLGYAYSSDGVHWTKHAGNPITTATWTEDVSVVRDGNTYYLFAEDESHADGDLAHIDLFTSTDRIHWTRYGTVVSGNSSIDWEAREVGTPTVWKEGQGWYMLYEGIGFSTKGQVGLATSVNGINWTKHSNNPVLQHPVSTDYDIAIDSIIKINGVYYAYGHYEAFDRSWNGGMFTSTDLLSWTAYSGNPLPYNSPVIVDNGTQYFLYSLVSNTSGVAPYQLAVSNHTTIPPDVTAPVITQTGASNITSTMVTISWQTDELADSQVEYGLTSAYGASSPLDATPAFLHAVNLFNLQANTTYHYRVKSKDAAGNLAVSDDFTFTTAAESNALLLDDFNTGVIDPNKWRVGSNAGSRPVAANNALELRSLGSESGWVITREAFAGRNTIAAIKVVQPNNDGAIGLSPTYTLTSTFGIYNEPNFYRFYVYRDGGSGPYRLFAQWKKNGIENGFDVTGSLVINSSVHLRLRLDDIRIHFEVSLDGATWINTYNETFALPGYTLDHAFYYELAAYKTESNGVLVVDDFSLSRSPSPDTQPPQISQVAAQNITSNSAQISWQTDEPANSQVEYGLTANYGNLTPLVGDLTLAHAVTLSGLAANTTYHYRVKSRDAAGNLADSDGFIFQTSGAPVEKIVLSDALYQNTLGTRTGGQFVSSGGWQVTGVEDMLVYDLGRYIETGSLELSVRNFRPAEQNTFARQHFLSMFRMPWGNHHPVETLETGWDLHTGFHYAPGVKMLSLTYAEPMIETIVYDDWDFSHSYQLKVVWNGNTLQYFRNGVLYATHVHAENLQLRYLFVGRDLTVSADLITNFKNNQYPAPVGPIYSDLVVKETFAAGDAVPPQVANISANDLYANAVRLAWTTGEPAICYVEYGPSIGYGQKTAVLGPPAQTFSATLAELAPNQTHHYRIVASDSAGNVTQTADETFTTLADSVYLFKPSADTYVETAGLYGTTRDRANFGWMNLLASAGRECYLRFQVTNVSGQISQAVLRLHGRQSGKSGGDLRAFQASWEENSVTWLNKPVVSGKYLGSIDSVKAGEWQEVAIDSVLPGNGVYNVAIIGTGTETISWDSRESTNFQPELLVTVQSADITAPIISDVSVKSITASSATITWTTDENTNSQVEYGLTSAYGFASPLDPAATSSHSVALTGLQANTLYHYRVKSRDPSGNLAASEDFTFVTLPTAITLFADDFNSGLIDASKWRRGINRGNRLRVVNQALELRSQGRESSWLITRNNYVARHASVTVKVVQPNDDGALGFSPTYRVSSIYGIYNEPNFYRFYVYRDNHSGSYRLFVQWKKNGIIGGLDVTGALVITGAVYLRVRSDDTNVHFEASLNGVNWTNTYNERFSLPGYTLNSRFYYELAGYYTSSNGTMTVDDFAITSTEVSGLMSFFKPDTTAVEAIPLAFDLQNFPNPFWHETHIRINLPVAAEVRLTVFDLIGREIEELFVGTQPAGYHEMLWSGRNHRRNGLRTGVYFLRLQYRLPQSTTWSQIVRQVMMVR